MPDLIIENVRCFAGRHEAKLAPITILVGENSAGKSTFLAACRLAWDALFRPAPVDFNEDPFRLGTYTEIASRISDGGPASSFTIGFNLPILDFDDIEYGGSSSKLAVSATFVAAIGQPVLDSWSITHSHHSISMKLVPEGQARARITVKYPGGVMNISDPALGAFTASSTAQYWPWFSHQISMILADKSKKVTNFNLNVSGRQPTRQDLRSIEMLVGALSQSAVRGRPYAFAPIRTEPKRTYDPLTETTSPGGGHVPMLLARLNSTGASDPTWQQLITALEDFGSKSGLFNTIDVRRFGGTESNLPFQIRVRSTTGADFNLVDVGYGVSQVLPVLVDCTVSKSQLLLLQQPEVHLHPRAQAELATFFARLITKKTDRTLVIETHSDFLIDRLRMDIRDGITPLRHDDVAILYFERIGDSVTIHKIDIDPYGNIVSAPPSYRNFFLREEDRLVNG